MKSPDPLTTRIRAIWSGTPDSNRRPSPWQGADEDVHGDATGVEPLESETVAEISSLLKVRKQDVYSACDRGLLRYVKFEGVVQVEGREIKTWIGLSRP